MDRKKGTALVVGGGVCGIRAALDLAEYGYGVTLIEKAPYLGGILSRLDHQFPSNHCGMCRMLPLVERDQAIPQCLRRNFHHDNITVHLATELVSVAGSAGQFQVLLRPKSRWIDPERCVGCGLCEAICPVTVPDDFNGRLSHRKAVHTPIPHAFPRTYWIDPETCNRCGECTRICPAGAVRQAYPERRAFRIIVVDDELIMRDSLQEWLLDEGFTVSSAASGQEALSMLAGNRFNLMLLDIKMPGMDGVETLEKAKTVHPDLCVVMMTAFATVETAVETMRTGARDYLLKPFDPAVILPKIMRIFTDQEDTTGIKIEVNAIILCGGTDFYHPETGKNPWGYGCYPNVVTHLTFERMLSGTGPYGGKLVRPSDGKPVKKIAWIQCVGSRNSQLNADFCSSVCCMAAIKEALLAKDKSETPLETSIFYMDMRTWGKSFERYRNQAETMHGVRMVRERIHSLVQDTVTQDVMLRYADRKGMCREEPFDLAVLSVGQRPASGAAVWAKQMDLTLNSWGMIQGHAFAPVRTSRDGILVGGSCSGLKDIGESLIYAGAAALEASRLMHAAGGSLQRHPGNAKQDIDPLAEPRIWITVCWKSKDLADTVDEARLTHRLRHDPALGGIDFCYPAPDQGWQKTLAVDLRARAFNRLLIVNGQAALSETDVRGLTRLLSMDRAMVYFVDLSSALFFQGTFERESAAIALERALRQGMAYLKRVDPRAAQLVSIQQQAVVIGAGIAGMTAALAVAEHGFPVDLVETAERPGGHLQQLERTLSGCAVQPILADLMDKVERHPRIRLHCQSRIIQAAGEVGHFVSTLADREGRTSRLSHGVTIIATGAQEAKTCSYGHGNHPAVLTQMELEHRLHSQSLNLKDVSTVVMILCVDSREEPRNYCSRVCCPTALRHALLLKARQPDTAVIILYRDMMTCGFDETYYTQARQAEVIFIQYDLGNKPQVETGDDGSVNVTVFESIVGRYVHINPDLLVLATGLAPVFPTELARGYGIAADSDGFFQMMDSKWRPVDGPQEGVFACGTAHSPRLIPDAVASAQAAAMQALKILSHDSLSPGKVVAKVRTSLCVLCERCIAACPYGARMVNPDTEQVRVNPVICRGCGNCAAVCPNGAAVLEGLEKGQLLAMIDAALS